MTEIDPLPHLVEQIHVTIASLRKEWAWLEDLVEPGRDSAPLPLLTDAQRARQAAAAAAERDEWADQSAWLPRGARQFAPAAASALAPSPAAARVTVVDARIAVHHLVVDVAHRAANALATRWVGGRAGDAAVVDVLDWLEGPPPCWIATADGTIWRIPPGGALAELHDVALVVDVDAALQRALAIVRRACRDSVGEHTVPVDHRCPACGRRSLQLDYVHPDLLVDALDGQRARRGWTVNCISEACRCTGEGCGCRQRVRYAGRRHAWRYGELSGPDGLWTAIAVADRRRRGPDSRVGSGAAGHGGWAERRTAGRAVRDAGGVLWWDRERACAQLGVRPQQLWDWVRLARERSGFPNLAAPRRDGPVSWYRADQLLDVEWHVSQSTRGRRRSA